MKTITHVVKFDVGQTAFRSVIRSETSKKICDKCNGVGKGEMFGTTICCGGCQGRGEVNDYNAKKIITRSVEPITIAGWEVRTNHKPHKPKSPWMSDRHGVHYSFFDKKDNTTYSIHEDSVFATEDEAKIAVENMSVD